MSFTFKISLRTLLQTNIQIDDSHMTRRTAKATFLVRPCTRVASLVTRLTNAPGVRVTPRWTRTDAGPEIITTSTLQKMRKNTNRKATEVGQKNMNSNRSINVIPHTNPVLTCPFFYSCKQYISPAPLRNTLDRHIAHYNSP